MTNTSRYENEKKYVAFIDGLYIVELCNTDSKKEFLNVYKEYGDENGFRAFIDGEEV